MRKRSGSTSCTAVDRTAESIWDLLTVLLPYCYRIEVKITPCHTATRPSHSAANLFAMHWKRRLAKKAVARVRVLLPAACVAKLLKFFDFWECDEKSSVHHPLLYFWHFSDLLVKSNRWIFLCWRYQIS